MGTRLDLQSKLEEILGNRNVYFQPPESKKIEYDAFIYSLAKIESRFADDALYSRLNRYELIYVYRMRDESMFDKILSLPYCAHDRHYVANNLNHDVFTLYY